MNVRRAVLLIATGFACAGSLLAQFTFFPVTPPYDEPRGVCLGPDGNIWFSVGGPLVRSRVGRVTPAGVLTEFSLPDAIAGSGDIVAGPDGNLWFLEDFKHRVGRISPAGVLTEFPIPGITSPAALVVGPDGAIWVSDTFHAIWRVSLSGAFTKYPVAGEPNDLTTGSDGNLWFMESGFNRIGKMTLSGTATFFTIPPQEFSGTMCGLGPDGNVWYGTYVPLFGRITPAGAITEFPVIGQRGTATSVAVGPDGNLWMPLDESFVCVPELCFDYTKDGILQVSTDGSQTRYDFPQNWISPYSKITAGPQGSMWFTALGGLVRFFPAQVTALGAMKGIPATAFSGRLTLIAFLALAGFALLRR